MDADFIAILISMPARAVGEAIGRALVERRLATMHQPGDGAASDLPLAGTGRGGG